MSQYKYHRILRFPYNGKITTSDFIAFNNTALTYVMSGHSLSFTMSKGGLVESLAAYNGYGKPQVEFHIMKLGRGKLNGEKKLTSY